MDTKQVQAFGERMHALADAGNIVAHQWLYAFDRSPLEYQIRQIAALQADIAQISAALEPLRETERKE